MTDFFYELVYPSKCIDGETAKLRPCHSYSGGSFIESRNDNNYIHFCYFIFNHVMLIVRLFIYFRHIHVYLKIDKETTRWGSLPLCYGRTM